MMRSEYRRLQQQVGRKFAAPDDLPSTENMYFPVPGVALSRFSHLARIRYQRWKSARAEYWLLSCCCWSSVCDSQSLVLSPPAAVAARRRRGWTAPRRPAKRDRSCNAVGGQWLHRV